MYYEPQSRGSVGTHHDRTTSRKESKSQSAGATLRMSYKLRQFRLYGLLGYERASIPVTDLDRDLRTVLCGLVKFDHLCGEFSKDEHRL